MAAFRKFGGKEWSLGFALLLFFSCCIFLGCSENGTKTEEKTAVAPNTYLNHAADVKYTGIKSCVGCHQDIYQNYLQTGKGRSFYLPSLKNVIENFQAKPVYDKFSDLYYNAYWRGQDMYISEFRLQNGDTVHFRAEKVDYVIGSGNQTRT